MVGVEITLTYTKIFLYLTKRPRNPFDPIQKADAHLTIANLLGSGLKKCNFGKLTPSMRFAG